MNITINDKVYSFSGSHVTIMQAIRQAGIEPKGIAIAVNGTVAPRSEFDTRQLVDGDSLIIIKAFYGG